MAGSDPLISLALDHRHLAAATLRQPRGADVAGEHVRIAVNAERMFRRAGFRIVPGAGGQLQHAGHDVVGNGGGSQARAAIVEQADDVAIGDAAVRRIDSVETDNFAAGDFLRLAVGTEIELAVQPGRRLVGDQRQRVARTRRLGRRQPCRVRRAIVVIEARDGFRIDLDSAAWRRQLVVEGIVAEGAQEAAVIGGGRQREFAALPELVEARRIPAGIGKRLPRRLVKMSQPLPGCRGLP